MINKKVHHKRQFHLALWPSETIALIRIPAMITGFVGLLGALKYYIDYVYKLLQTTNLPPIRICWVLIILSAAVYALNLGCWLWSRKHHSTAGQEQSVSATSWRTL